MIDGSESIESAQVSDSPAIEERSGTETMAREGSIAFGGNLLRKLLGFVIIAVITRMVSPSVYGLFVLATSIVLCVQLFASLGLPKAIDYFVPQLLSEEEYAQARGVIVEVSAIVIVTSVVTAGIVFATAGAIASAFNEPSLRIALLILSISIPFLAIYNVLLASFNAIKRLKYRVYTRDLVRPIVRLIGTVALLLAGYGLLGIVGGYLLGLAVAIVVGTALLVRNANRIVEARTQTVAPRPLLWYSLPLALAGIIYVLLGQIDYFVIGYYLTSEDVGIYRVGYMLAANLLIFLTAVAPIFKPLIAEAKEETATVERRYQTATRWVAGLTLPLAITLALGADAYLSVVFTPQYGVASVAVGVLCLGYLINVSCGGPDGTLLQGLGYTRLVAFNTVLLLGSNITLSIVLVPYFGIFGAALATATALTIAGVAAVAEVYYIRGIHPFTVDLGKVGLAALPAMAAGAALISVLERPLAIALALPVVVVGIYAFVLVISDAFTEDDAQIAAQLSPGIKRVVTMARR